MVRSLLATIVAVSCLSVAQAHFVFVVPDAKAPSKVVIILSDNLETDDAVTVDKLSKLKLVCRDEAGKDATVPFTANKHDMNATIPGDGPRVVFGTVQYGVMQRGDAKPYLLNYHPKALLGDVPAAKTVVGEKALPVEIVPVQTGSDVKFKFLADGKPVADSELTILKPDGSNAKVKTNAEGLTEAFPAKGRYGVWAKAISAKSGELDGKKYDEVRNYATFVVEFPAK